MQWSKAKRKVELLFAPSVAGRVELRVTGYRDAHDAEGRGWITIDRTEAWSFCTFRYWVEGGKLERGIREASQGLDYRDPAQREAYYEAYEQAQEILARRGILTKGDFEDAVESYPALALDAALESDNLVHRALAMLDRRLGKRRLRTLELRTDEHSLVVGLLRFRCEAEGVLLRAADAVEERDVADEVRAHRVPRS